MSICLNFSEAFTFTWTHFLVFTWYDSFDSRISELSETMFRNITCHRHIYVYSVLLLLDVIIMGWYTLHFTIGYHHLLVICSMVDLFCLIMFLSCMVRLSFHLFDWIFKVCMLNLLLFKCLMFTVYIGPTSRQNGRWKRRIQCLFLFPCFHRYTGLFVFPFFFCFFASLGHWLKLWSSHGLFGYDLLIIGLSTCYRRCITLLKGSNS